MSKICCPLQWQAETKILNSCLVTTYVICGNQIYLHMSFQPYPCTLQSHALSPHTVGQQWPTTKLWVKSKADSIHEIQVVVWLCARVKIQLMFSEHAKREQPLTVTSCCSPFTLTERFWLVVLTKRAVVFGISRWWSPYPRGDAQVFGLKRSEGILGEHSISNKL